MHYLKDKKEVLIRDENQSLQASFTGYVAVFPSYMMSEVTLNNLITLQELSFNAAKEKRRWEKNKNGKQGYETFLKKKKQGYYPHSVKKKKRKKPNKAPETTMAFIGH